MAMSFVNAGAVAAAASGNVTPALPAAISDGDVIFAVAGAGDNIAATAPAAWTRIIAQNSGTTLRLSVWVAHVVTGLAAPLITHAAGNTIVAFTVAYRQGSLPYLFGASTTTASATITAPTLSTLDIADMIIFFGASSNSDTSTAVTTSTYVATNPSSLTERFDNQSGLGTREISVSAADALQVGSGVTGNCTATSSVAGDNVGVLLALSPQAVNNNYQFVKVGNGMSSSEKIR